MKNRVLEKCLYIIAFGGILDSILIAYRSGGVDTGILLPAVGGVCVIFWLLFMHTGTYRKRSKAYSRIAKVVSGLFVIWLVSFIIVMSVIMTSAISDNNQKVESVIVLGAGLKGESPTSVLKERLDYTIGYFKYNPDVKIIVSGGQGFGEVITEAEGMKRYLVRHGVPENIILKEERSTSTYENMIFSKKLYEDTMGKPLGRVMIITNDFHMFRSKMLARRAGLRPYGISSATPWYIYPNVCLREYFALFKSLVFDR
ncbi:MAG TPA: YdcF family protein [Ruminiclostridium sp.]|nr:YdcF family protein [Ruminiclostridium sp.]